MRKKENHFIKDSITKFDWNDNAIYSIGVYDPATSTYPITFYIGEADVYKDRPLNYTPDVMAEFGRHEYAVRIVQMFYRSALVKKKLEEMGENNPFDTTDMKTFRHIVERMYIDLFHIPPRFNKKRLNFSNYQLSAAFILHVLSRKYKSISECLDMIENNIDLLEDFDYPTKKFVVYDFDSSDIVDIKMKMNSFILEVLDLLKDGKYLQQGGYQCWVDGIIYESDDIKVIIGNPTPGLVFVKQLWNSGYGNDCISIYKDSGNKVFVFVKPQPKGLGVDIESWISKEVPKLGKDIVNDIKREILLPSKL